MVINLVNVIEEDKITYYGSFNIALFTLIGFMGIFMGLFFGIHFLIQSNTKFLIINSISFFVGIMSLIFLYWYTGKN